MEDPNGNAVQILPRVCSLEIRIIDNKADDDVLLRSSEMRMRQMKQMIMCCCAIATKKKTTCCDLYPGVGHNGFGRHSCMETLSRAWSIKDSRPQKWVAAFALMTKAPTTGFPPFFWFGRNVDVCGVQGWN